MIRTSLTTGLTTGLALAVVAATALTAVPANAAMHRRTKRAKVVRLVPAVPKPSFRRAAPGGPMMLLDVQQVPAGGGALGLGIAPSTGVFKGVPLLGDFNL